MSDDLVAQWKRWEAKYVRMNLLRRRLWFWFVMAWGALFVMIFIASSFTLSPEFLLAAFGFLFAALLGTLIAAIACAGSERVARQQLERLDKILPSGAEKQSVSGPG